VLPSRSRAPVAAGERSPLLGRRIATFVPEPGGKPLAQLEQCLHRLEALLSACGLSALDVLRLTFFVDEGDAGRYAAAKKRYLSVLQEAFGSPPPPTSFVVQPPEECRHVALEAAICASPAGSASVERRSLRGIPYTVVAGRDCREIHAAGITSDSGSGDVTSQARAAFEQMKAILCAERMTFGHVLRQWNYIEGLLDVRLVRGRRRQNYQAFNDVRSLYYAGSTFPSGYPAATGIGQAAGGVILEFVALSTPADARVVPLSNPLQADAHRYSADVLVGDAFEGIPRKTAPKFERAKLLLAESAGRIFVSGTAAILGERSVGGSDPEAQTRTTIANMAALLDRQMLRRAGAPPVPSSAAISSFRAYVKRAVDIPGVRQICEAAFGPVPALYLRSDVCREELLVEIEGVAEVGAAPARP
jgi:enamine deaminase RidA (YjgF/YER057c/UK114 family)